MSADSLQENDHNHEDSDKESGSEGSAKLVLDRPEPEIKLESESVKEESSGETSEKNTQESSIVPLSEESSTTLSDAVTTQVSEVFFLDTTFEPLPRYRIETEYNPDAEKTENLIELALVKGDIDAELRQKLICFHNVLLIELKNKRDRIADLTEEVGKSQKKIEEQALFVKNFHRHDSESAEVERVKSIRTEKLLIQNQTDISIQKAEIMERYVDRIKIDRDELASKAKMVFAVSDTSKRKEMIKILQAEVEQLSDQYDSVERKCDEHLMYLVGVQNKSVKLHNIVNNLVSKVDKIDFQFNIVSDEVEFVEDELYVTRKRLNETNDELISTKYKYDKISVTCKILEAENRELLRQTRKWDKEFKIIKREVKWLRHRILERKTTIETEKKRIINLYKEINLKRKQIYQQNKEVKQERKNVNHAQSLMEKSKAITRDLKNKIEELKKEQINTQTEYKKLELLAQGGESRRGKAEEEVEMAKKKNLSQETMGVKEYNRYQNIFLQVKLLQTTQWQIRKQIKENNAVINSMRYQERKLLSENSKIQRELDGITKECGILQAQIDRLGKDSLENNVELQKLIEDYNLERVNRKNDLSYLERTKHILIEWTERNKMEEDEISNLQTLKHQLVNQIKLQKEEQEKEDSELKTLSLEFNHLRGEIELCTIEKEAREEILKKNIRKVQQYHNVIEDTEHEFFKALEERNYKGLQLRDALEEKAIFMEKVSTFQDMIDRGNEEFDIRDDVVKRLEIFRNMEKNSLDNMTYRKILFDKTMNELEDVLNKMEQLTEKRIELENKRRQANSMNLINMEHTEKYEEMQCKEKKFERRLHDIENKLTEINLLEQGTVRLFQKLEMNEKEVKQKVTDLNKKKNKLHADNNHTLDKLKSLAVEVAMKKVEAETLKAKVDCMKHEYSECLRKIKRNEPLDEKTEKEWLELSKTFERKLKNKRHLKLN